MEKAEIALDSAIYITVKRAWSRKRQSFVSKYSTHGI